MRENRVIVGYLVALVLLLAVAPVQAKETVVTAGDTLRITVPEEPSLSQQVVVNDQGKITLPHLGEIEVKGQSTGQIGQTLVTALSKYVKSPTVIVELVSAARQQAAVYGQVRQPGSVELKEGDRLLDVISRAGGLLTNADKEKSTLMRQGQPQPMTLDLNAIYKGDLSRNLELKDGDTLFIPERKQGTIKVMGEVQNSPTELGYAPELTLAEAISLAGSFKPSADRQQVRVIHKDLKEQVVNLENPLAIQSTKLEEGDVVYVPNNEDSKFTILGGVNAPAKYPWKPGMTLTDAIATAQGFKDTAKVKRSEIKVARAAGPPVVVDLDKYFKGDVAQNVEIKRGDTILVDTKEDKPRTSRRSLGEAITGLLLPAATLFYYLRR
jgi:protein involved in polysaccharide export with SLBB domain